MDQSTKRIGLVNWLALLVAMVGMLLISRYVSTAAGVMGTVLVGFGLLVSLITYFQMGLLEREQFEKLELEELSKSRGSESLFAGAGADTFPAKRSREIFDRFFIPSLTALLFVLQGLAAWWPWTRLPSMPAIKSETATLGMALIALLGLILFMLGKYSSGIARLQKEKLLRPGAAYLLLSAYTCFLVTVTIAATTVANLPKSDLIVARFLCVVIGLVAVETLLGLILEVYRVRVRGGETRVLYESRLVGLLGQPEAIITTAAHALDYQFGFKISESWFYRFLEKAFLWLVLAQLVIFALSTCFVVVQPGDEALLERFGRPLGVDGVIGPGLHFKLPWPIDKANSYHTQQIQRFVIGAVPDNNQTVVWSKPHSAEENFLVASRAITGENPANNLPESKGPPVSLMAVSIPVQYQITNLAAWAYINRDPDLLLEAAARREVMQYLASADFDDLMSKGREAAAAALRENIQKAGDQLQLGARIVFVGLEDIHPPSKVAEKFEEVVGAGQTKEATILQARAYEVSSNAWARAESAKRVWAAVAAELGVETNAVARAMLFTNQILAYNAAPGANGVYEQRARLEVLVKGGREPRKYIIATTNTPQVLIYDLEDKIRPDLVDQLSNPSKK